MYNTKYCESGCVVRLGISFDPITINLIMLKNWSSVTLYVVVKIIFILQVIIIYAIIYLKLLHFEYFNQKIEFSVGKLP